MPINECRKAAAEWCAEYGEGWSMKDYVRFSRQNVDLATMDAHLAGQECGEKRERGAERAATVAWLRMIEKRTRDYSRPSTESLLVADEYDYIARTIMSGEHRGGG